jgi:hypothetical protein
VLVRIRDTITRTISPTTATTTAAATLVMYLLRCAATNGIYRELRSGSNCYNLVANTITRKRLAAKQRRSVLLQIIRPQPSARARAGKRSIARSGAATFTMPMYTMVLFARDHFYAAPVLQQRGMVWMSPRARSCADNFTRVIRKMTK